MRSPYLKPWIIVIVLACLLPVFFSSCKDDESYCVHSGIGEPVVKVAGSIMVTDRGPAIVCDSTIGNSVMSVIIPEFNSKSGNYMDLSDNIGANVFYSGVQYSEGTATLKIVETTQTVNLYVLCQADLVYNHGWCGTQFSSEYEQWLRDQITGGKE